MGSLDERNPSYWITTTDAEPYPPLAGDLDVEVAVVGGGLAGLLTAAAVAEEGLTVAVLEAGRIAAGTTGYTTAKITSQHGLTYAHVRSAFGEDGARTYGEANQAAIDAIESVASRYGIDCGFERAPAVLYATSDDQAQTLRDEHEAALAAGLPSRLTGEAPLPFTVTAALWFDGQAMFHPRAFCLGLARALRERGVRIYEQTRVTGAEHGEPCEVRTDAGVVRADDVVLATQIPFLFEGLFFARAHAYRSYAMAVAVDGDIPQEMYLSAGEPVRSLRPIRWGEDRLLLVGGEGHKTGQDDDESRHYEALESWAREHFAVREIVARWSAQDYVPNDGVPYIGSVSESSPRILVATGFKKWGMTTSAVAARILADEVAGKARHPWADLFDAQRTKPIAAASSAIRENLNVAKHLVGDRIAAIGAPSPDELAPGQGAICSTESGKAACYRDDDGRLHAVSAKCTHLGCLVQFNDAERTWDCPCHGSRFGTDGRVLNGPATSDLAVVELESR